MISLLAGILMAAGSANAAAPEMVPAKGAVETQVVIRRADQRDASEITKVAQQALSAVLSGWEQPEGARTVVRLNGVWLETNGQWRLSFRVVADYLDLVEKGGWVRLGDSKTVTVTDKKETFQKTLSRALDVGVDLAMGTK